MSAPRSATEPVPDSVRQIRDAVAALGDGPLHEAAIARQLRPLFARALAPDRVYLANHSLGRAPDSMAGDVAEALGYWYRDGGGAWAAWLDELARLRAALAELLRAPAADCVVPRASAGQGLRAVLNALPAGAGVVTTRGEFDSIDFILRVYTQQGRVRVTRVPPRADGRFAVDDLARAIDASTRLVVVSLVMFRDGQVLTGLDRLAAACHARGAWLLVDLYHAAGVLPVDLTAMDADFAVGGCYKYLRGGPGSGWLYVRPQLLGGRLATPDIGWFAKADRFDFTADAGVRFAAGGDALLESTPAVLPWFQARAGLALTLALGVDRLRAYNLQQQALLTGLLDDIGMTPLGDPPRRGAFVAVPHPDAAGLVARLHARGVVTDARHGLLRIGPDLLTTQAELRTAVDALAQVAAGANGAHARGPGR